MKNITFPILIFLAFSSLGQSVSDTILLNNLVKSKEPIIVFSSNQTARVLKELPNPFNDFTQQIVVGNHRVIVLVGGTGRLYEYLKDSSVAKLKRIESTEYRGYNFGSFAFFHNNNIYNLSGWGFWRVNGHLIHFNERIHDWDIVPLSEEIAFPFSQGDGDVWYDNKNKKIYTSYYLNVNEGIKQKKDETKYVFKTVVLDLNTMNWEYLGELNESLRLITNYGQNIAMTSWGLLKRSQKGLILWNYRENRIYEIKANELSRDIIRGIDNAITYSKDSTLFMYHDNRLDSIQFHYADFKETDIRIFYTSYNSLIIKYWLPLLLLSIIVIVLLSYILIKKIIKHKVKNATINLQQNTQDELRENLISQKNIFTEQELILMAFLYQNSKVGKKTSISDINSVLGIESRNLETQKNQRFKIVNGINSKYLQLTRQTLIKSERSPFDARMFDYYIEEVDFNNLDDLLY